MMARGGVQLAWPGARWRRVRSTPATARRPVVRMAAVKDVEVGDVGLVNLAANIARCGAVSR